MNLKHIMPSKRSQTHRAKHYMTPVTGHSGRDKTVRTENKFVVAKACSDKRVWLQRDRRAFLQRIQPFGILIVVAVTISKKNEFSSV